MEKALLAADLKTQRKNMDCSLLEHIYQDKDEVFEG